MGRAIAIIVVLLALAAVAIFWMYRGPSAPMDRVAATKQRVQEAIARTEAHRYAPEAVSQIQRRLDELDRMIDAEQKKLPFQRNYDGVLDLLDQLDLDLQNLDSLSQANKQTLSDALAADIDKLVATADAIDNELRDMPSAKGSRPALGAMRSDLADVRRALAEAQELQKQSRFQQAQQKAATAQANADALLKEIRDTKERVRALRQRSGP